MEGRSSAAWPRTSDHGDVVEPLRYLLTAIETWHQPTRAHLERVAVLSHAVATAMQLPAATAERVYRAALLHDIGNIVLPPAVLDHQGPLDDDELRLLTRHAMAGADILSASGGLDELVIPVRYHHEWWNGGGYPDRLAGTAIPIESSVIAVADALDAMTTFRPYRRVRSVSSALIELAAGAGTQFHPECVAGLQAAFRQGNPDIARWGTAAAHGSEPAPVPAETDDWVPLPVRFAKRP